MKRILSASTTKAAKGNRYIALLATTLLWSCATSPEVGKTPHPDKSQGGNVPLTKTQEKVIEGSYWALGKSQLKVRDKVFNLDCSGTVMAIYYYAGIDLSRDFAKYSGGGTERIFRYLEEKELLYDTEMPVPGDIIFWDNTYDKNGDGKRNDKLTHVGIVVEVDEEGTITYLHEHYKKGIILETMNLKIPDDQEKNSAMRMKGTGMDGGWLSSHLYRILAMAYELEE